jgi:hypothetical protein
MLWESIGGMRNALLQSNPGGQRMKRPAGLSLRSGALQENGRAIPLPLGQYRKAPRSVTRQKFPVESRRGLQRASSRKGCLALAWAGDNRRSMKLQFAVTKKQTLHGYARQHRRLHRKFRKIHLHFLLGFSRFLFKFTPAGPKLRRKHLIFAC